MATQSKYFVIETLIKIDNNNNIVINEHSGEHTIINKIVKSFDHKDEAVWYLLERIDYFEPLGYNILKLSSRLNNNAQRIDQQLILINRKENYKYIYQIQKV